MTPATKIGARRHLVTLENPGTPVPDGDGGFTQPWVALNPPTLWVSIEPATAKDLERVAAGTVLSTASHIVKGLYHPGVTTQTRLLFNGRIFNVTGVSNTEERNIELVLMCVEVVA